MPTRRASLLVAVALAHLSGCAHGPRAAPPPLPAVTWPAPPAVARLRLAAIHSDATAPAPRRSPWRALLAILAGAGGEGPGPATLVRPFGVALRADGGLVVADPDAARVLLIGADGSWADLTCRGTPWEAPIAVAAGRDGEVFVADAAAAVVVRWSAAGCARLASGDLERPSAIALGADRIFVADPPRHEVVSLSYEGRVLGRLGGGGSDDGRLSYPTGVAIARDDTLLVVDSLNFRIARFSADGTWLGSFGSRGDTGADLARPKAVAVDGAGRIYVTDSQRDAVLVFGAGGAFEYLAGETGETPGAFALPAGIAIGGGGAVYVADSQNRRIQVFEIVGDRP